MNYQNDIPFFGEGLPLDRVCFSGGRVAADLARHGGLTGINYFGRQRLNQTTMFAADVISAWKQLFRLFVEIDGRMYYAEFNDTCVHPYGYESTCSFEGVTVRHRLTLLNDALVFEMDVLSAPENCDLNFTMAITENCVKAGPAVRQWSSFEIKEETNSLIAKAVDDNRKTNSDRKALFLTQCSQFGFAPVDYAETFTGLTSSQAMTIKKTPIAFEKDYARIRPQDRYGNFIILFGHDENEFQDRLKTIQKSARRECEALRTGFADVLDRQTRLSCADPCVQSLMNNARNIIQSLKVKDIPGGMRAADSGYWIWGWDSMVYSDAAMLSGDHAFVEQMLEFFRSKSHPELGIFHSMDLAGNPDLAMAPPAQTLYCIMLYNHQVFSQNSAILEQYYPFARKVILNALEDEVNDCGLIKGVALYPDFPEYLDQTGSDISAFNNSIAYQAVRCMQELAARLGKREDAEHFGEFASRMKASFNQILFDEEKGYYLDSVSSDDFSPRRHYPVYAILRVTPFADELSAGKEERIAKFMHENLRVRTGVCMLPHWDSAFMAEGNQLGMYMPVTEGFYRHMMREGGYDESLLEVMAGEWSRIMIPEALAAEAVNHGLTPDNPGRKQAFCLNAWYSLFFSYYLGVSFGLDHLSIDMPMASEPAAVSQLAAAGKRIALDYQFGTDKEPGIYLNGQLQATHRIAYSQLEQSNEITVVRTKR